MRTPTSLPLTVLQEQFWFREMMSPGARAHILTALLIWTGRLEEERLRRAVRGLADRHPSLRMRVAGGDASTWAEIEPRVDIDIAFLEAADVGFDGLGFELPLKVRDALAGTPFDLERGPIFRMRVYRFDDGLHAVALAIHHIAADGWSVGLIARDLGQLYLSGETPRPAGAGVSIGLGPRAGPLSSRKLDFWKKALDGAEPLLNLPAARPRPPVRRGVGAVHVCTIDAPIAAAVDALANERGATVFTVCAAAAAALLGRLTGKRDIVVGVPLTNRGGFGEDEVVGLFANALPIRLCFDGETNFADFVDATRAALVRALFYQDVPFERIVRAINPPRDAGQHPVFQVVFNHFDFREPAFTCGDFTIGLWPALHGGAGFDVELHFVEHAGGLAALINYDSDLFDAPQVERWASDFTSLLEAFVADPGQRVAEASAAAPEPRAAPAARAAAAAAKTFGTLHERVLEQAVRCPEAIAAECEGRTISYRELVRNAAAVAARLEALGAGPDRFVPVYLERSIDLVVAILGVLMAGAAYVPIDPSQPPDRVAFILDDVDAVAVVTEPSLESRLPPDGPARVQVGDPSAECEAAPALRLATGNNYAYCIYTSGSQGKPKGVIVRHRNATRLFSSTHGWFGFGDRDVWTMFHSHAFDFSVWEIFGALLYGGRLVIVPQHIARTPEAFLALLREAQVTVLNQTPSAFQQLLAAARSDPHGCDLPALRLVIFGGEALNLAMLKPWFEMVGDRGARLVNMYGITETTVHVTYKPIGRALLDGPPISPIGVPIGDLDVHVLDSAMRPVPAGAAGEIYVGGAGVAAGYLKRDELTAERFLADPFSSDPGARLYRSGDLARLNAEGELEYLGRADDQIKLRGHRIEPAEIEAALADCPDVAAAAVRAVGSGADKRLVAWVAPQPGHRPGAAALRSHLEARLPPYMIPADIVLVEKFPLTVNGKLDWNRLPVPDRGQALREGRYEPPATAVEAALARLWEEILEVPRIGRDDNFFAAGGDSIRAAQCVRAARLAGLPVSVADVFRHQTVRALAAASSAAAGLGSDHRPADLAYADFPLPGGPPDFVEAYPLTGMQRLMVKQYAANADHGEGVYHAQQAFRIRDDAPSPHALQAALQAMVDSEPVLRTRFLRDEGGCLYQAVRRRWSVDLAFEDLTPLAAAEREQRLLDWRRGDRRRPFGIGGEEPLVRFAFFHLAPDMFEFAMAIHHAIDDGWGNNVFLQRLFELYAAAKAGPLEPLAPVTNVFREYVAIEREGLERKSGEAFWSSLQLPVRCAEEKPGSHRGQAGSMTRMIEREVVESARRFARTLGVTLKAVFLQAFIDILAEHGGGINPTVGMVANGRTDRLSDPFHSLGLFWNLVPLRNPAVGGSWRHRVDAAHRRLGDIEAHATVPLDRIRALHGGSELFQATFNFVNFHNSFTLPPGLDLAAAWWHDRFHYPLNLLVALDRSHGAVRLQAEYVGGRFADDAVEAMLSGIERIVTEQCSVDAEVAHERV